MAGQSGREVTVGVEAGGKLDKYNLLERVGQGGMSVVYRGRDTSLRREVAVKVLHRHLAESQEARDRFEREAHAVAKLHHENILEIFDFSGTDSDESYIVTEFIDGQTLKEFTSGHDIQFPEVGALISTQVSRALAHAHKLGVLHRDVKPENIMIRRDGVVKLTDFGIAQMLDLQRMTVTGQLLGSPAYMSPEHVEGRPLDFRTDVFALGIVLYQLVTGELPFKGKNPHEILKRIAEGKFIDPQIVNPRVGNQLGRIVLRALAREKEDRYPDVEAMLGELESYLAHSGLSDDKRELASFFHNPIAYESELRARLLEALTAEGKRRLGAGDQVAALELFNRVLTLDPRNTEVLAIIDRVGRRRRRLKMAGVVAGVGALATAAVLLKTTLAPAVSPAPTGDAGQAAILATAPPDAGAPRAEDASAVARPPPATIDAAPSSAHDAAAPADAHPRTNGHRRHAETGPNRRHIDAAVEPDPAAQRWFTITVSPRNAELRIGDGPWVPVSGGTRLAVPPGRVTITARNTRCCADASRVIPAEAEGGPITLSLGFLPATLTPVCDLPGVGVKIDGQPARLGRPETIVLKNALGTRRVTVLFFGDNLYDERVIDVRYKQNKVVPCRG